MQQDNAVAELEVVKKEAPPQEYRDLKIDPPMLPLRVTFDPPIDYDGQTYKTVILDFEKMNGKDFDRLDRDFTRLYKADKNEGYPLPETKHLYYKLVMAHLSDAPLGLFMKMPRRYYVKLRLEVVKACGSSSEEENP